MRPAILGAAALAAAGAAAFVLWPRDIATVTVLLRCDEGVEGILDFASSEDGETTRFAVADACNAGVVQVPDAGPGQQIGIEYQAAGAEGRLVLRDGDEIDRTTDGPVVVLEVRRDEPHLRPGQI